VNLKAFILVSQRAIIGVLPFLWSVIIIPRLSESLITQKPPMPLLDGTGINCSKLSFINKKIIGSLERFFLF